MDNTSQALNIGGAAGLSASAIVSALAVAGLKEKYLPLVNIGIAFFGAFAYAFGTTHKVFPSAGSAFVSLFTSHLAYKTVTQPVTNAVTAETKTTKK